MAKKITTHSGRKTKNGVYSSRHNDRNFDLENAKHIDPEKTKDNFYYNFLSDKYYMEEDRKNYETFKESEDNFYQNNFSNWLNTRNEKHKKSRHKERIKKMKDLQKMERYAPEEVIFQIGNKNNNDEIDNEIFWEAMSDYLDWFDNEYGENVKLLNCGYHVDETTPHFHIRQVFLAHDQDGNLMPNQTKALEELGVQCPDPTKKKSRYNNPKMTFTVRNRQKLIEICENRGLEIDTEVKNPSQKHKDLLEYKTQKLEEEKDFLNKSNTDLRQENLDLLKNNSKLKKENKDLKDKNLALGLENRRFKAKNEKLEEENKKLKKVYNSILKDAKSQEDINNAQNAYLFNLQEYKTQAKDLTQNLKKDTLGIVINYINEKGLTKDLKEYLNKPAKDLHERAKNTNKNFVKRKKQIRQFRENVNENTLEF